MGDSQGDGVALVSPRPQLMRLVWSQSSGRAWRRSTVAKESFFKLTGSELESGLARPRTHESSTKNHVGH